MAGPYQRVAHGDRANDGGAKDATVLLGELAAGLEAVEGAVGFTSAVAVMSVPPTVTITQWTSGGASTISGATRTAPNSEAFTYPGTFVTNVGTLNGLTNCYAQTGIDVSPSGVPYNNVCAEWETNAPVLDVILQCTDPGTGIPDQFPSVVHLTVDGERATAEPYGPMTVTNGFYRVKIDFGTSKNRRLSIEGNQVKFMGVYVHPVYSVWRSSRERGPKWLWVADSFGSSGSAVDNTWAAIDEPYLFFDSFPKVAGRLLGVEVYLSAVGSTSYLNDGGFGQNVPSRWDTDVAAFHPDAVVVSVGLNDRGLNMTSVQSAINSTYTQAAATTTSTGAPTPIYACDPFSSVDSIDGDMWTIVGYLDAAAVGKANVTRVRGMIDWLTGTGHKYSPQGDGNRDFLLSGDQIHPSLAGHLHLGHRIAGALRAVL